MCFPRLYLTRSWKAYSYYSKTSISRTSLSRNPLYLELILRSLELPYTLALALDPLSRTSLSRKTVYLEVKSLVPQAEFVPLSRSRSIIRVIHWGLHCLFNRETVISTCVSLSAPSSRSVVHAFTALPKAATRGVRNSDPESEIRWSGNSSGVPKSGYFGLRHRIGSDR